MMVEVFKTNVLYESDAMMILHCIHKTFVGCEANFDLSDCDNILRIKYKEDIVTPDTVIELLYAFGFTATILSD